MGSRHCWVVKYLVFVACMLCCFLCSPENSASRPSRSWLCASSSYHRNCVEAIKRGPFMLYVIQWTPFSANMKGWRCLQVRSVPGEEARISGSCFDHQALTTHLDVARQLLVVSGELKLCIKPDHSLKILWLHPFVTRMGSNPRNDDFFAFLTQSLPRKLRL